jgi:hypothetical protein
VLAVFQEVVEPLPEWGADSSPSGSTIAIAESEFSRQK